ncbi:peroxiredoxin [Thermogemmatispora sp.]|uniref:peroxiredoxin n=1 Tax=Thermogemmatispora sp. TaxID=1968838 RepID=UPI001D2D8425|nr:peroxiredoxin [Thermogemmatispora sp.]MBX5448806.1 peroxiredoxin [Thermogemmatispora sp.]
MSASETAEQRKKVQVGDLAPDFTLPDQTGRPVSLHDFIGKAVIVLYFYPKDNTPGCTAEAVCFRDSYVVFKQAGAEVIGVSSDSSESHQQFANQHRLPFILLSDQGAAVRKRYGVPTTLGLLPGRVTYIIDKRGVVRHIFSSQFNPEKHVEEALTIVRALQNEEGTAAPSEAAAEGPRQEA